MVKDVGYGDLPIGTPEQDLFGIDPFVKALARSIKGMRAPQGEHMQQFHDRIES